jgi:hypothetical protein
MKNVSMVVLSISNDFTPFPGARYYSDGPFSGQEFYEKYLKVFFVKAITENTKLVVNLDNTAGYASSFLSESFGLLAEEFGIDDVLSRIEIISLQEPDWKNRILNDYIPNAKHRKNKLTHA